MNYSSVCICDNMLHVHVELTSFQINSIEGSMKAIFNYTASSCLDVWTNFYTILEFSVFLTNVIIESH